MSLILSGTDGLSDVDGSAATPAIRGTDTNTGIFFPAADTIAFAEGGVEAMRIDSSGNLRVGTTSDLSAADRLTVVGGNIAVQRTSGITTFLGDSTQSGYTGTITNHAFAFLTNSTERARIDSSGNLLVGTTSLTGTTGKIRAIATGGSFSAYSSQLTTTSTGSVFECTNSSGTYIGGITCSNTATSFPTSSDYRLKDITGPVTGTEAKNFIMALQPKRGKWKVDGSPFVGFLAHEFQEVSPSSVNGEKDAVTKDGVPVYQSLESSSPEVMANLIALIQEQQALITSLTARIAALEGAAS